jgi:hypothetical protein
MRGEYLAKKLSEKQETDEFSTCMLVLKEGVSEKNWFIRSGVG